MYNWPLNNTDLKLECLLVHELFWLNPWIMEPDMSDHKLYMNFQLGGRSVPLILTMFMGQLYTEYQSTVIWKLLTIPEYMRVCVYDIIKNLTFSCLTVPLPVNSFTAPCSLTCSDSSSEITNALFNYLASLLFFYPCYIYFLILLWFHGLF